MKNLLKAMSSYSNNKKIFKQISKLNMRKKLKQYINSKDQHRKVFIKYLFQINSKLTKICCLNTIFFLKILCSWDFVILFNKPQVTLYYLVSGGSLVYFTLLYLREV